MHLARTRFPMSSLPAVLPDVRYTTERWLRGKLLILLDHRACPLHLGAARRQQVGPRGGGVGSASVSRPRTASISFAVSVSLSSSAVASLCRSSCFDI